MSNPIQEVRSLGQSIWYDNIRRGLIKSGELKRLIDLGVTGLTSNPSIFEKAIAGSNDYDDALLALASSGKDAGQIFEALAIEDIQAAADLLRPYYQETGRADGYACLEVSPRLAHDTQGTIAEARRLFTALDRPNVMVKVPATPEGIPAIRTLIGEGINVNVTLLFSRHAYDQVREAYLSGLEDLDRAGGDVSRVASVASFFVSRVDTAVDTLLERRGQQDGAAVMGQVAIANARLSYQDFKDTFSGERFTALKQKGARAQRPLWASTGTKNPSYSDVMYVESLIGPDTVDTLPEATLNAFLEHGKAAIAIENNLEQARKAIDSLGGLDISLDEVTDKLLADGVAAFAQSYDKLLENLDEKKSRLLATAPHRILGDLGHYEAQVEATISRLGEEDVACRIWRRDHTVWKEDPTEITNRLGWLTVTDMMDEQVPALEEFAEGVKEDGFQDVVLLGMGGSSLGPEVLRQTFGSAPGYPTLRVLDSTVPGWIKSVTDAIDPARTLFLVSSKSGSTIEPNTLYAYFRSLVEQQVGRERAGQNFVAITDGGTSLERLAQEQGFRKTFLNPADIGGRYSALSYFGLVPAALMGLDLQTLLDRAECLREGCASCVAAQDNPGVSLGAAMATLAQRGRDKLTLVTSPSVASFGLWAEQMLAESLGKEGKGIVPVANEPLLSPDAYGNDRLFVYLREQGDDNAQTDAALERVTSRGNPVMRLDLKDRHDLGAEFFRWEFATAVAGAVLDVHPFDQPDVQSAKDMTDQVLRQYQDRGDHSLLKGTSSLRELLAGARPGDYLAIMAYLEPASELDEALAALRQKITERHGIATTLGYGPRYLHSTGQLHKGGPDNGLFLQLTANTTDDLPIPGYPFTFGLLAQAQAQGDLEALQAAGRRAARVHLGPPGTEAVLSLIREVE